MKTNHKNFLNRSDWLKAALQILTEHGVQGVKISPLAEYLQVTRGSFYWHFRDRRDLLKSMLDYWEKEATLAVIYSTYNQTGNDYDKLHNIMEKILSENIGQYDLSIRAWALFDPIAAVTVKKVDVTRLEFMSTLLRGCGITPEEAEIRSRILISSLVGEPTLMIQETEEKRRALFDQRLAMITEYCSSLSRRDVRAN